MMRLIVCDGRVGVQGGKGQVTGFGDTQRRLDRLQIAHLTDQHDVGVLTQRGPQCGRKGHRIGMQLALIDQAALVRMQVFDRIFDRDDVFMALSVDLVDHRRDRRRLTGTGRAGDEHQASRLLAQRGDDVG